MKLLEKVFEKGQIRLTCILCLSSSFSSCGENIPNTDLKFLSPYCLLCLSDPCFSLLFGRVFWFAFPCDSDFVIVLFIGRIEGFQSHLYNGWPQFDY